MEKCALITGGTKGIGKAVALCLGKAGYNLVLTYASDPGMNKPAKVCNSNSESMCLCYRQILQKKSPLIK